MVVVSIVFILIFSLAEGFDDKRISTIERLLQAQTERLDGQNEEIVYLRKAVADQNQEILKLRATVSDLRKEQKTQRKKVSVLNGIILKSRKAIAHLQPTEDQARAFDDFPGFDAERPVVKPWKKERRLLNVPTTTGPSVRRTVAFYSYLSHSENTPGAHHILIFDVVKTNINNAYNMHDGVFTAPYRGVYGFIYTVRMSCNTYGTFQIMKNSEVQGNIHINTGVSTCTGQESTGSIIVVLEAGDIVYVRTHPTQSTTGPIVSNLDAWPHFTGWLISELE